MNSVTVASFSRAGDIAAVRRCHGKKCPKGEGRRRGEAEECNGRASLTRGRYFAPTMNRREGVCNAGSSSLFLALRPPRSLRLINSIINIQVVDFCQKVATEQEGLAE